MNLSKSEFHQRVFHVYAPFFLLFTVVISSVPVQGQTSRSGLVPQPPERSTESTANGPTDPEQTFRVERIPVDGGAELITIFAKQSFKDPKTSGPETDIPLLSVVRDTLGDDKPENDRLRYVWMLTYTRSTLIQKASAFVPFLYSRTTNKNVIGSEPPPPIIDIQSSNKAVWNKVFWMILKKIALSEVGIGARASALQYRQNGAEYRRSAIASAMTVLSLYQDLESERVLSDTEMRDIYARLSLSDKTFGGLMQSENLGRVYDRELTKTRDDRGHNWELLRQYSEAQGLYFEPLEMADGRVRHAIVWADAADIAANKSRKFDSRFLNIKNPWTDPKLSDWKGYSEVRWFDADDRRVEPDTPNSKPRTMIPLALYGLDNPKIPLILIDFRDGGNAKFREMSKRILSDLSGSVISLSRFGGLPAFLGKFVFDFVTGRRGMDINQASRVRSYAQLKLLLSLEDSLDPEFHKEIASRVEYSTLNPLENDTDVEARLAHAQYDNLIAYAKRPDGLSAKIMDDRREEMTKLKHGRQERTMFAMAHFFSFGLYTHREDITPGLLAQMDERRQLEHHERVLREIAFATAKPEIDSNLLELKSSLLYISRNGSSAKEKTTKALTKIFKDTDDDDMRSLCLIGLYRVNNSTAKNELLAIYNNSQVDDRWRNVCAHYLRLALKEGQRMSYRDAKSVSVITAN